MRVLTLSIVLLVVAALLVWLLLPNKQTQPPCATDPEPAQAPEAANAPHFDAIRSDAAETSKSDPVVDHLPNGTLDHATSASNHIEIEGRVIVTDSNGVEHPSESGTLTSTFDGEITITAGCFRIESQPRPRLHIEALRLGGRPALSEQNTMDLQPDQTVTIRAKWVYDLRLSVLDARSHLNLSGVKIVRGVNLPFEWSFFHPGPCEQDRLVLEQGVSPIVLEPLRNDDGIVFESRLWITATDHAWARVEVDTSKDWEYEVLLEPAASLIVSVSGELPSRNIPPPSPGDEFFKNHGKESKINARLAHERIPQLRLRKPSEAVNIDLFIDEAKSKYDSAAASDFRNGVKPSWEEYQRMLEQWREQLGRQQELGELLFEQPATLGESQFDELPPGNVVVSVEVGAGWDIPLVACDAVATLVAGTTTRVDLVLKPMPSSQPVPLAGTLYLPEGWPAEKLTLRINPTNLRGRLPADSKSRDVAKMETISGRRGWYRWSAGLVRPARYWLYIEQTGVQLIVDVAPPGREDLEIVVPEAATLKVRFIDDASGALANPMVDPFWIAWRWIHDLDLTEFNPSISFEMDPTDSLLRATVPIGRGVLEMQDPYWVPLEPRIFQQIHPGVQELVVRVRRASRVNIEVACDGVLIDWPDHWTDELKLESVGHSGESTLWSWHSNNGPTIQVSTPGRYRLLVPTLSGFEPVEPTEIDVPAGQDVTHTIALRRARR